MEVSNVTSLLYDTLKFRGDKQNVISSNIANINTPNYKTKELTFDNVLNKTLSTNNLQLSTTNSKHIQITPQVDHTKPQLKEVQGLEEQNDGNNVNLDTQMSEMAKNTAIFQALQASIKKDGQWFKEVIAASGKN